MHNFREHDVCMNVRVSEWLLFNANSTIFQLYHRENKFDFSIRYLILELFLQCYMFCFTFYYMNGHQSTYLIFVCSSYWTTNTYLTWFCHIQLSGLPTTNTRITPLTHLNFTTLGEDDKRWWNRNESQPHLKDNQMSIKQKIKTVKTEEIHFI
jgi:hypothetical protein